MKRALFFLSVSLMFISCSKNDSFRIGVFHQVFRGSIDSIYVTGGKGVEKFGEIQASYISNESSYKFNEFNKPIEFIHSDGKIRYKYDSEGNMFKIENYKFYGNNYLYLDEATIFTNDNNGFKIFGIIYDSFGSVKGKIFYRYDIKGNIIEEQIWMLKSGILYLDQLSKFNDKGECYEQYSYYNNKLALVIKLKYDENHNAIEYDFYEYNKYSHKQHHKLFYDDNYNIVKDICYIDDELIDVTYSKYLYK